MNAFTNMNRTEWNQTLQDTEAAIGEMIRNYRRGLIREEDTIAYIEMELLKRTWLLVDICRSSGLSVLHANRFYGNQEYDTWLADGTVIDHPQTPWMVYADSDRKGMELDHEDKRALFALMKEMDYSTCFDGAIPAEIPAPIRELSFGTEAVRRLPLRDFSPVVGEAVVAKVCDGTEAYITIQEQIDENRYRCTGYVTGYTAAVERSMILVHWDENVYMLILENEPDLYEADQEAFCKYWSDYLQVEEQLQKERTFYLQGFLQPAIRGLMKRQETLWLNPKQEVLQPNERINGYGFTHIKAAQFRFMRYLPYVASAFPETAAKKGVIESPFVEISAVKDAMNARGANLQGRLFLKDDARMPIAGSVKARGGIHEVMKIAETLAMEAGMMMPSDDHAKMDTPEFRAFFSQYTIHTGSTGNLGLAIGRMASRLGFTVVVHMSHDAKEWKKQLLREAGATVKEYEASYVEAVAAGRAEAESDEKGIFIDDERSVDLFLGYATAVMRLRVQMNKQGVVVDQEHPLFVYLPCGVGGAPGGITFGLKVFFGDAVHCFFAEPVEAPCMLLGMASERHHEIDVAEIGLTGRTIADGLAVTRPSGFVCHMMEDLLSGVYTVSDERLLAYQKEVEELTGLYLEPSACAGFYGAEMIGQMGKATDSDSAAAADGSSTQAAGDSWADYIRKKGLAEYMANATHIVWGTGGGLVPEEVR